MFAACEVASGIDLLRSHENELTTNTTNLNGTFGIVLAASNDNVLRTNTANVNTWVGIELLDGASNNTVLESVARRNGIFDAAHDFSGTGNVWTNNNFGTTEGIE
jgi:parallel beta-helix repeat protein